MPRWQSESARAAQTCPRLGRPRNVGAQPVRSWGTASHQVAALLLIATPRPGLVVQSGGLYTRLDGYGPLGSTSGAGRPSDVRRRRRPPSVGHAWTGSRAVHTYHPGPIRGPVYHPTTRAGGPRQSGRGRARLARTWPSRSSGDHHPGEGRAAPGRWTGRWRRGPPALGASPNKRLGSSQARSGSQGHGWTEGRKSGNPLWAAVRAAVGPNPGISTPTAQ